MNASPKSASVLEDVKVNVKLKLAGLWVAALFSWVYEDLLRLYSGDFVPGEFALGGVMSPETM